MSFAQSLLPSTGYICVAELIPNPEPTGRDFFKNYWLDSPDKAERWALKLSEAGRTVFIAQGSFAEMGTDWKGRKGEGALAFRNFFLDIDCGEGKPYATQREGLAALGKFCKDASLPIPSIVNSGNGLYAHWVLDSDLPVLIWHPVAAMLQKLVKHYEAGLDIDGLASDRARVLRPVGATNYKKGQKPVTLLKDSGLHNTGNLCRLIKASFEKIGEKLPAPKQMSPSANAEFLSGLDEQRPSSAEQIATKCAQVAHIKAVKGDVAEPYWYAVLGLLRFTTEAPEIIHDWSCGHGDYSREATDSKIIQHERSGVGPTTCARLSDCNPDLCKGCVHVGKVKSPITLGYTAPAVLVVEKETGETLPTVPQGFAITDKGMYFQDGDTPVRFYEQPVYITSINIDHFGESFTIRHRTAHDGWQEVTMASNKVCRADTFYPALIDAHIHVVGKDNKGLFMVYIETFMQKLRSEQRMSKLSGQMGWVGEGEKLAFIHGDSIYRHDGSTQKVGYSATAPEFVKAMHPAGDMTRWIANTDMLNQEGLEGQAFEFLCTAFGSPLVRFSGYEGALVSIVGGSGLGKTLTGKWGLSAWGDPSKLLINQDDTTNVMVGRLGVYNTLPAYIDEISNITPENLSHLAYRITQGRDKIRMDRNAKEKSVVNEWNLLGVVTSNHSLMDKLLTIKGDPGAEFNRIFEYEIAEDDGITAEEGLKIFESFATSDSGSFTGRSTNYGQVGRDYALYLVQNQEMHRKALTMYSDLLAKKSGARADERFWVMTGAVAIYGGTIAKKLGLCHIDVEKLIPWVVKTIQAMRRYKNAQGFDAVSFLGNLLDTHANGVLCVASYDVATKFSQMGYREPKGGRLVARIELDKMRLWISADVIRQELQKRQISVRKMAATLMDKGLESTSARIGLGRGTIFSGVSQAVWEFNLYHPALGHTMLTNVMNFAEGAAINE